MKKIIIFDTAIATSNLGDEIILNSIYDNMAEIFDQGTAIRLGTHVANYSPIQMLRGSFKIDYAKKADWKFICGTNLITQKMFGRGMINPQWAIGMFNYPLYLNSVLVGVGATGKGEKLDFLAEHIYKKIFSSNYIHSVRDEQTKRIIESVGFKAVNTGCPTLWKLTPDFCAAIPTKKADSCVVSVSGYLDQRDYDNDKIMLEILENHYKKCYVWIQTTEDEEYFNMLNTMKKATKIYTLSKYRSVLKQGNIDYIGTRLHGGYLPFNTMCVA